MPSFLMPGAWPEPADPVRAARLAEQIRPRRRHPQDAALIACLGGNSPYLTDLALRERTCFDDLLRRGPDAVVDSALATLAAAEISHDPASGATLGSGAAIASALRQAKRQVALASAVADIGGIWDLEQVTGTLTALAEATLGIAIRHLLRLAARRGELTLPDLGRPEQGCGFVILGMGKLGAGELNYSSDIDLVLLYDPDAHPGREDLRRVFTRMAADLVTLMEARDADGYVFRTDLRLRPDPASTPPAVSLPAAIAYYESQGQTWERAAMTKARPVAGDRACGAGFLQTIRPFIWRRHLDFAAIEDIHVMKRRIDQHRNAGGLTDADPVRALLGHNLKLGHGGIREIEFLAQTMQLVWGGRAPELREATTLGALARLAGGNYLPAGLASELAASYRLLRRAEHRLQMQDDRQTHSLPGSLEGFDAFARFMGEAGAQALAGKLIGPLRSTRGAFEDLFAEPIRSARRETRAAPLATCGSATFDWTRFDLDQDDLAAQLAEAGFPEPLRAAAILTGWRERRWRALRSDRAQSLLRTLMPALLAALREQHDPTVALARFDTLLARQNAGVQLLSLFGRNPPLLGRLAVVLGAAPSLADHLAAVPAALEGLLVPEAGRVAEKLLLRLVDAQMRAANGFEEAIRRARPLVRGEEFRLALAQMDGRIDVDRAGTARSALADRVMARMLDQVWDDHRDRYGRVDGGAMVVVALGKAGSREMMAGSDLDLMLVYDHPEAVAESMLVPSGRRPTAAPQDVRRRALPVSQYYTRLAHSLIAALSAPGVEGPLYALDMRLRPSGSKGPVAVSLAAFERYHAERSWTWERMALCRARVVAGPGALRTRVGIAIGDALDRPRPMPRAALLADAAAMRGRIASELPPEGPWDVKRRPGGLLEVEFIAQILQLASDDAALRHPTTRTALRRLARGGVLTGTDAARLIEADRFWRAVQSMLRILFGTALPGQLQDAGAPVLDALLFGIAVSSGDPWQDRTGLPALEDRMQHTARAVREIFVRLIGEPGPVAGGGQGIA